VPDNRQLCFVIMPFSKSTDEHTENYWTQHFESFLKPLIEENPNFQAHRSEELRGDILNQIITSLVTAPIVVADLTDHNCNVFWELGIRQSFKHCTVTIEEFGTRRLFDLSGKATLSYYPKDHIKMQEFKKAFKQALNDCIENPSSPDSHVLERLGGRGTLFEVFRKDEAMRRLDALISECQSNLETIKNVVEQAQYNQTNPTKVIFPTGRLRTPALESLITNRYIDEQHAFFSHAEWCLQDAFMLNAQLNTWEDHIETTEKYLLEAIDSQKISYHEKFTKRVKDAQERLRKSL